jgi:hypothetical protein
VKIKQYCSVCREELPMEVVPTENGEDDGVIWLRCPRCQGFLPKVGVTLPEEGADVNGGEGTTDELVVESAESGEAGELTGTAGVGTAGDKAETIAADAEGTSTVAGTTGESIPPEYEAMLAAMDASMAVPYRPWSTYEVGDTIHHLAWDDCGVVVAKEPLPGLRRVVKVYFEKNGLARLIEAAPEP